MVLYTVQYLLLQWLGAWPFQNLESLHSGFSASIIVCSFIVSNSWMTNDMVNALTPHLIGKRPNTYTFTKSLAEHVLLQEADNFPIAIFRPSIIGAAWKEPYEVSAQSSNYMYSQVSNFLFLNCSLYFFVHVITVTDQERTCVWLPWAS